MQLHYGTLSRRSPLGSVGERRRGAAVSGLHDSDEAPDGIGLRIDPRLRQKYETVRRMTGFDRMLYSAPMKRTHRRTGVQAAAERAS